MRRRTAAPALGSRHSVECGLRATCRGLRGGFELLYPLRSFDDPIRLATARCAKRDQAVLEPSRRAHLIDFMGVRSYKPASRRGAALAPCFVGASSEILPEYGP